MSIAAYKHQRVTKGKKVRLVSGAFGSLVGSSAVGACGVRVGVASTLVGNTCNVSVGVTVGVDVAVGVAVSVAVAVGVAVGVAVAVSVAVGGGVASGVGGQKVKLSISSGAGNPLSGTNAPVAGSTATTPRLSL